MRNGHVGLACCARCAGPGAAALSERRQLWKSAVFPPGAGGPPGRRPLVMSELPRVVTGAVLDVSPHVLVVGDAQAQERLALTSGATVWRAGAVPASALRAGEPVIARLLPGRRNVAGRVWASIGRVTGTIVASDSGGLLVDVGAARRHQPVVISPRAISRIRVRIPQLSPGNLIDVIGLRRGGTLEAHIPATAQPAYLAGRVSRALTAPSPPAGPIRGSATWHEPYSEYEEAEGAAYPAIDPSAGCAEGARASAGCCVLPYLAVGSRLIVRNECTGAWQVVPVTSCGAIATQFHDRCLACGTSPRGRIVELTMTSFVALGGDLEKGCFNATIETRW